MKIMLLCDGYGSYYAGNHIPTLRTLVARLRESGDEAIWVFGEGARRRVWCEDLVGEGETVYFLKKEEFWKRYRSILRIAKVEKVDLIHQSFGAKRPLVLLSLLHPEIRVVHHHHSDWSLGREDGRGRIRSKAKELTTRTLERRMVRLCVSEPIARKTGRIYVPNGLALDRMTEQSKIDAAKLRDGLGIGADAWVVLMFGWSPEVKGVDIAVEAVALLREAGELCELVIVCGEDLSKNEAWIPEHTSLEEIEPWVHLVGPLHDVFTYHYAADVALSASRSEGFPFSVLEAICAGRAVCCSSIEGTSWARDFSSVVEFRTEDPRDCADALLGAHRTLNCTEEGRRMLASSATQCMRRYNADVWADTVYRIYREAMSSRGVLR